MRYTTVEELNPRDLEDQVNKMNKEGWLALGGVSISTWPAGSGDEDGRMITKYVQALVKGDVWRE